MIGTYCIISNLRVLFGLSKSVMDVILVVMGCLSENKNGEMPMHKQGWDDVVSPSYLEGLAEIENIWSEEKKMMYIKFGWTSDN